MRLSFYNNDVFLRKGAKLVVEEVITAFETSGQRTFFGAAGRDRRVVPGSCSGRRGIDALPLGAASREGVGMIGGLVVFIGRARDRKCVFRAAMVSLDAAFADGTEAA